MKTTHDHRAHARLRGVTTALTASLLSTALLCVAACTPGSDWRAVAMPPMRPFTPQQPKRLVLNNGMIVFLQENHELPLISGTAILRGGSQEEPAEKAGLVDLFGQVWRQGGTKAQSGDALDDFLESRAAKVETGGDGDSTSLSFSCLKDDLDEVFPIFADLLRGPELREEKLQLAKAQMATGIVRRNDDVGGIASRESAKLAYGPRSALARQPELATLKAITREDLVKWHADHVHPSHLILGLTGDFDADAMAKRLSRAFDAWGHGPDVKKVDLGIDEPKPGVYFIEKPDVNQSTIRMVHLGTTKKDPDYHAIEVVNAVFGHGFSSRLFSVLRTQKGLAYGVSGGIGTQYAYPGVTQLGIGTKSGSTAAAITGLYDELERLQKEPPTAQELQRAKDNMLKSFVFRFDSRAKVLSARMLYEFHGYPADWLEQYRAGIEKVTVEDAARVARKHFQKERLRILVVGNSKAFDKPLATFGPVTNVDITIPR